MLCEALEIAESSFGSGYLDANGQERIQYVLPKDLTTTLSMSTREIAELTGKLHPHVMRDFRDVCEALEIEAHSFVAYYIAANGKENPEYLLPKDLTTTLVSGYSIPMRHKIVQRWKSTGQVSHQKCESLPRVFLRGFPPLPPLGFSRNHMGRGMGWACSGLSCPSTDAPSFGAVYLSD